MKRSPVRARCVVNATGVWADDVRALDEGSHPASIRPAKGVHITLPWAKVRNDIAAIVPVGRRSPFRLRGAVGRHHLRRHDRHRLRRPARRSVVHRRRRRLPARRVERRHRRQSHRSRRRGHLGRAPAAARQQPERPHRRPLAPPLGAHTTPSGVVTVTGGKLTTYRRMAADAVDAAAAVLGEQGRRSPTRHLRLVGGDGIDAPVAGLETERARAPDRPLRDRVRPTCSTSWPTTPRSGEPLVAGLPYLRAEAGPCGSPRDGAHPRRRARAGAPGPASSRVTRRR